MDASQEEKQNYLRENILEKGYDANDFVEFLKSKKGDQGADVSNWTMEDLKQVVAEFISLVENHNQTPNQTQNENIEINQQRKNSQKNKSSNSNNTSTSSNNEPSGQKDEDFGIEFPDYANCQNAEAHELSKFENVEIKITSYKKVDKGIFTKTFFSFLVETNPLTLKVYRRYSDFEWLKERLSIIFNTDILPRLSKKGKIVEERKINRRMRDLEKFLNFLLKDPLIKGSKILFDFLAVENEDEFQKVKKVYDKMKTPTEIKDFRSVNGKVKVNVNKNKEKYLEYIRDNAAFNETALKKLDLNFKDLRILLLVE